MQPLLIAVVGGLGGMLGWGFADFSAKKTVDGVGSIASLVWAHIFGVLIFLIAAIFSFFLFHMPLILPQDLTTWIALAFFGALQTIVYLLLYNGLGKGKVSLLNPVFSTYSGIVALVSIVFLGEMELANRLLGIIVLFAGVLFINIDISALRLKRLNLNHIPGLKEVAAAAILAAVWTLGWDKFISGSAWLSNALLMYFFMTVTAFIIAQWQKADLKVTKSYVWKYLVLIGLGEAVAYIAISLGFSLTPFTSVVAVISGASALPTIILARIFLKEQLTSLQTIGTLIIIAGVAVLSL